MTPAVLLIALHLATPLAGGSFTLECEPNLGFDGIAYAAETTPRVVLAARHCRAIARLVKRPRSVGTPALYSLQTLLHEARHIGQYREGFPDSGSVADRNARELDAECRANSALGPAARTLGVRRQIIRRALREMQWGTAHSPPPYGGRC